MTRDEIKKVLDEAKEKGNSIFKIFFKDESSIYVAIRDYSDGFLTVWRDYDREIVSVLAAGNIVRIESTPSPLIAEVLNSITIGVARL